MARMSTLILIFSLTLGACESSDYAQGEFQPHVYLNWASEDTFTTMQVNYHTDGPFDGSKVYYDTQPRGGDPAAYRFHAQGHSNHWPGTERRVHHVELTGLTPGLPYYFIVGDSVSGYSEERKFRTLNRTGDLRFVTGGDTDMGDLFERMCEVAGNLSPQVALVGGDLAYDDGKPSRTYKWDAWLRIWGEDMVTADGYMIPQITAIGNHEVNILKLPIDRMAASPFYFSLFDQDKGSYFMRWLREDVVLFVLDTNHQATSFGAQREWLKAKLEEHKHVKTKMVLYHAPLYPSHRSPNNPHLLLGRWSWLDLFDHYGVDVALENHDHTFKRTHFLKNDKVVDPGEGTLYLGDGAWGKHPRGVDRGRWYLNRAEEESHIWMGDIGSEGMRFEAYNKQGQVFDNIDVARRVPRKVSPIKDNVEDLHDRIRTHGEMDQYWEMYLNERQATVSEVQ